MMTTNIKDWEIRPTVLKIAALKPAKYNPRKITDWELRKLMRSIESFGFVEPVVVNKDGTIIGGHQRIEAAKNLGMEEVPVVQVDMPENKAKALNLALNRIGGEFDDALLKSLLEQLGEEDKMLSGFDEKEIAKLLQQEMAKQAGDEENGLSLPRCPECGQVVRGE